MSHLATNQYPWSTFYRRSAQDFEADLAAGFDQVSAAGLDGFEPIASSPGQIRDVGGLLQERGLEMRSIYVNSTLHDPPRIEESMDAVLAIADAAYEAGTRIIVTNPSPLQWGGPDDKNDAQLETQALALEQLGRRLADMGLVLAYHNHDAELRHAAREFHHMMTGTDPRYVTLCLDAHWIFRGAGNSAVAVYDVVSLYGNRVTELHLRQSVNGVWQEAFGPGDIDYPRIASELRRKGVAPHLVLEQAVEQGSPNTLGPLEAHRRGVDYARKLFASSR